MSILRNSSDEWTSVAVIFALSEIGGGYPEVIEALKGLVRGKGGKWIRRVAAWALVRLNPSLLPYIPKELKIFAQNGLWRYKIIGNIVKIDLGEIKNLFDRIEISPENISLKLGANGNEKLFDWIRSGLYDYSLFVRILTLEFLRDWGNGALLFIPELKDILLRENNILRSYVVLILQKLNYYPPEILSALEQIFEKNFVSPFDFSEDKIPFVELYVEDYQSLGQ